MMLIGQYDSPFVRRVGIALTTYGLAFEHAPWSTFGDADKIAKHNPLRRVPTLVMDGRPMVLGRAGLQSFARSYFLSARFSFKRRAAPFPRTRLCFALFFLNFLETFTC